MSDELRHNPDLDALWEEAGKAVEKFAQKTNQAATDLRKNDLLDEAFGVVKKSADATDKETKNLGSKLRVSSELFSRLNNAIQSTVIPQSKAMDRYHAALDSIVSKSSKLGAIGTALGAGPPNPSPRSSSGGIFKFYSAVAALEKLVKRIQAPFGAFSKALSFGAQEVAAEFQHMVGQLKDFGNSVGAGVSKLFATVQPYVAPAITAMAGAFQSVATNVVKFSALAGAAFGGAATNIGAAVGASLGALASALGSTSAGVARGGAALCGALGSAAKFSGIKLAGSMTWLGDKIIALGGGILGNVLSSIQSVSSGGQSGHGAGGLKTGSEAVGALGGIFQSVAAMVAGPMAKIGGALIGGAESIGQFVGALNPGIMVQFNRVLQDLNAVIGTALEPIMQAIVPLLQEVADVVLPIAQKFAAILRPFMEAIAPLVSAFISLAATVMDAMMPVLDMLATALGGLAKMFTVIVDYWTKIFRAFVELAGALFKGLTGMDFADANKGLKQLFDDFASGMKKIASTMILVAAMIAKQFGATSFIDGLIKAHQKKPEGQAVGLAAAQNPAFKSIESLGRDLSLQAAIATSGAQPQRKIEDVGIDMLAELKKINEGKATLEDVLKNLPEILKSIPKALDALPGQMAEALKNLGVQARQAVGNVVVNEIKREWEKPALQKVLEFVPLIRVTNIGMRVAGYNGFGG